MLIPNQHILLDNFEPHDICLASILNSALFNNQIGFDRSSDPHPFEYRSVVFLLKSRGKSAEHELNSLNLFFDYCDIFLHDLYISLKPLE